MKLQRFHKFKPIEKCNIKKRSHGEFFLIKILQNINIFNYNTIKNSLQWSGFHNRDLNKLHCITTPSIIADSKLDHQSLLNCAVPQRKWLDIENLMASSGNAGSLNVGTPQGLKRCHYPYQTIHILLDYLWLNLFYLILLRVAPGFHSSNISIIHHLSHSFLGHVTFHAIHLFLGLPLPVPHS